MCASRDHHVSEYICIVRPFRSFVDAIEAVPPSHPHPLARCFILSIQLFLSSCVEVIVPNDSLDVIAPPSRRRPRVRFGSRLAFRFVVVSQSAVYLLSLAFRLVRHADKVLGFACCCGHASG